MKLTTRYVGASGASSGLEDARVAFATNTLREATFFHGQIAQGEILREALGALHDVVVGDFRYHPRDRLAWKAWLAEQDRKFVASLKTKASEAKQKLEQVDVRLAELDRLRNQRLRPFHEARRKYADYVVANEWELSELYDPVVTVHPDEVFFEAFSKDESSYARLSAKRFLWTELGDVQYGTTNIDFSAGLARQLDRLRSYRRTTFDVAPGGLSVSVDGEVHKEKKIQLPESWVNGFLQVQATTTMALRSFDVHPIDLYNVIRALLRRKARTSPKALRFELEPGKRVRVVLEPWEDAFTFSSVYGGAKAETIRTWGRVRLQVLRRLLPVTRSCRVFLAGFGLPSFYVMDLGPVAFTLGLSGWTDNDWTEGASFELLSRRVDAAPEQLLGLYTALKQKRVSTVEDLAVIAGLSPERVRGGLSSLCQVGRATHDLVGGVYRHRDLFADGFTLAEARRATTSSVEDHKPEAKAARMIFDTGNVRVIACRPVSTGEKVSGSVLGTGGDRVRPQIHISKEGEIIEGKCSCSLFREHGMTRGPCEHLLALRLAYMDRAESGKGTA